jgi:hypothetical protein
LSGPRARTSRSRRYFLPLLLKKRLADDSVRTLDEFDHDQLRDIEQLLVVDPFSAEAIKLMDEHAHPWTEWQNAALISKLARELFRDGEAAAPDSPK